MCILSFFAHHVSTISGEAHPPFWFIVFYLFFPLTPNSSYSRVFVDRGYRGHGYEGQSEVHVDRVRRGRIKRSVWKWMKRRSAIEPTIGHLKRDRRLERNRLKGTEGDRVNAILSAAAMNFSKLLKHAGAFWRLLLPRLDLPSIFCCRFHPISTY